MYYAVYPSGCVILIFNCNDDGCSIILVALLATDRRLILGCCAVEVSLSCALPSV